MRTFFPKTSLCSQIYKPDKRGVLLAEIHRLKFKYCC
jgi:hypothetical protein